MPNRNFLYQNLHDLVVQTAFDNLDKTNYRVYKNPGQEKNTSIDNKYYPDIIITGLNDNQVKFIIEVETDDSINIDEAQNQWKVYAENIRATFYLLVPFAKKQIAISLCKQIGISVRFGTYKTNNLTDKLEIIYE